MNGTQIFVCIILTFLGGVLALGAMTGVRLYDTHRRTYQFDNSLKERVLGSKTYQTHIIVQSFNAPSRTMLALFQNPANGQGVLAQFTVPEQIRVIRRDAIVENGVYVGSTAAQDVSTDVLERGVRALVVVELLDDGTSIARYIMVGHPYPRP
jgi:hypothetical protein